MTIQHTKESGKLTDSAGNCHLAGPEKRCVFCRETQFISYREFGSGWPAGYQSFATHSSGGKSNTWSMAMEGTGYQ